MSQVPDLTNYQVLTLAAVAQVADLVSATARGESRPEGAKRAVKSAILTQRASSLAEVFPDKSAYQPGIRAAIDALSGAAGSPDVLRYSLQLLDLANRLKRAPAVLQRLESGLDRLEKGLDRLQTGLDRLETGLDRPDAGLDRQDPDRDPLESGQARRDAPRGNHAPIPSDEDLSALYQDTISTLGKRIQVTGNPQRLNEPDTAASIRALLLAGVRFGWLWQQLGGRRWRLMVQRRAVLSALESLQNTL